MISAKVIADSSNQFGNRITTMVVTFPRIILAEFNTHRMFSRNSAFSRAIPFEKMLKSVEENPFIPIAWQKDHSGMQGTEYCNDRDGGYTLLWLQARYRAIRTTKELSYSNVTKQLCNRLLEPFMWHTVIVTATEWENFFALRCPKYEIIDKVGEKEYKTYYRSRKEWLEQVKIRKTDYNVVPKTETEWLLLNKGQAEIHMMALAEAMWDALNESTPKQLEEGEWHIPFSIYEDSFDLKKFDSERNIKIATARCARVSYTTVGAEGKEHSYEDDIKLHDRLLASGHMSPFEHCAKAMGESDFNLDSDITNNTLGWSGNFRGFIQYRKTIPNESVYVYK